MKQSGTGRNRGRQNDSEHGKRVGVFIRLRPGFAEAIQTAKQRKGLDQAAYIETLIATGDQGITFKAYPKNDRAQKAREAKAARHNTITE